MTRLAPVPGVRGNLLTLALGMTRQWWRHLLAVAAATAVVTTLVIGSLGVGDGIQQGLRRQAAQRLGGIKAAVLSQTPFRADLAQRLGRALQEAGGTPATALVPASLRQIRVIRPASTGRSRATSVAWLVGCDQAATLGFAKPCPEVLGEGVALSEHLAAVLDLAVGDAVVLRAATGSPIPADTPLGDRRDRSRSRRLRVTALLPPGSVGDFSLQPSQPSPGVALVSLAVAQDLLEQPGRADVILATQADASRVSDTATQTMAETLAQRLPLTLADLGLVGAATAVTQPWRLTSERLVLEPAVDEAAATVLGPRGGVPTLVFLANRIWPVGAPADVSVPYSTILGIDGVQHPWGKLVDAAGKILPRPVGDEVIINQWMATDLAAQGHPVAVGDRLQIAFFAAETLHGQAVEESFTCQISGIAAMEGLAVARDVVPTVNGVTDEASIADWDPPFPFDRQRVRATPPEDQDERYWQEYAATPKVFMPLERARQLAGSRFGETTAWHLPALTGEQAEQVVADLAAAIPPAAVGLQVVPLAAAAAVAASGSTPFGLLFLALSSFVIIAGFILLWLLFGLFVASRTRALGILAAVGWPPARLASLLVLVASPAVVGGVVAGLVLGPLWAQLLLARLGGVWTARVAEQTAVVFAGGLPTVSTLLLGAGGASLVAWLAVWLAARRAGRRQPLWLVRGGQMAADCLPSWCRLRSPARTLSGLAVRGLGRRPSRSLAVVAMVALAEFLIVFVAGFELTEPSATASRETPTGGWTHLLRFAAPTSLNPTLPETSGDRGLSTVQRNLLHRCELILLRSTGGEDANCSNLYATTRPVVLGLPPAFLGRGGFRFVANAALPAGVHSPWRLLTTTAEVPEAVPVILDAATAQWALKLGGVGATFRFAADTGTILADDEPGGLLCQIVGLLEPGILQGTLLVSEAAFTRLFPRESGYRLAVLQAPAELLEDTAGRAAVAGAVTAAWSDCGVEVELAADRLRQLFAVQNTFLAGFQALGTLGLMLGTAGVAAVAVQGAVERRGSLAVLQALGFRRARLAALLWLEMMLQVIVGITTGATLGLAAALPFLSGSRLGLPWGWLGLSVVGTLLVATVAGVVAVWSIAIPRRPVEE